MKLLKSLPVLFLFLLSQAFAADNVVGVRGNNIYTDNTGRQWQTFVQYTTDGNGNPIPIGGSGGGGSTGLTAIGNVRNDYSGANVTTSAYVQLVSSTSDITNQLSIFDSSGQTLVLAVGAMGDEVDQILIFPGGNGDVKLRIPSGSRVSVKAVSNTAASGELDINFLK